LLSSAKNGGHSGNSSRYGLIEARREEIYQSAVDRGLFTKQEFDEKYRGQFLLGCVYCALGNFDEARKLFHQALQMLAQMYEEASEKTSAQA